MKLRGALLVLFMLAAGIGLVPLLMGLTASGVVTCPGENVGADGEQRPGPMRPGDTRCAVWTGPSETGIRTYEEQRNIQERDKRRWIAVGSSLTAGGFAGIAVVGARAAFRSRRTARWS
ncbi:hypothetical protein J7E91_14410 [Streptomyces sp. ISL-99]|uniref:hypothetical protein n=1 Tax=Streptomyces sp. ISL-99 TaxID=2819193 RepID=UPI001BEA6389|nr:hypothetical protein [Streptomyces sp. ISL-99]MBT2526590.1 hypothetical protein [Streptomyces sp. ISL-99]